LVFVLVLGGTAIALAATGVILTGSPVPTASRPIPTAGEGVPAKGASVLLPLRAADPAGGLPRGLICVEIGRVYHDQLGELGIDGAFANDQRFHTLPADALPDVTTLSPLGGSLTCAAPGSTYADGSEGVLASAAGSVRPLRQARDGSDVRDIYFGLLGSHAVSITYRDGSSTRTQSVLPGLGAYLLVQRDPTGQIGSGGTIGYDASYRKSDPASPDGALISITYRFAGRRCSDNGGDIPRIFASCGLSQSGPPIKTPPVPSVRVPVHTQLQIHDHVIDAVILSFRAPYAVQNATESYSASATTCRHANLAPGPNANAARGETVQIDAVGLLQTACTRSITVDIQYARGLYRGGLPSYTTVGSVTIHEPAGTHAPPLPEPPTGKTLKALCRADKLLRICRRLH
jgi:hypothetical protein